MTLGGSTAVRATVQRAWWPRDVGAVQGRGESGGLQGDSKTWGTTVIGGDRKFGVGTMRRATGFVRGKAVETVDVWHGRLGSKRRRRL